MEVLLAILGVFVLLLLILIAASVRILREYERGVIFRLGRLIAQKGPGLIFLIPFIDQMVRVDLRTVTLNVPPQEVITKDNVTVRVNAVAYFRVVDPNRAITEVENFLLATSQISQAANIISRNPATLQLRYLQTLLEMGVNQNTTIVFPIPLDLVKPFVAPEAPSSVPQPPQDEPPSGPRPVP